MLINSDREFHFGRGMTNNPLKNKSLRDHKSDL